MKGNEMLTPSEPFSGLPDLVGTPDSAMAIVKSMSEDQVRYALWAALILLFGQTHSNAPQVLAERPLGYNQFARESICLLAQVAVSSTYPEVVEALLAKAVRGKGVQNN